jgi:hypothetical protein
MLIILTMVLCLVGVLLAAIALRGRRVGDVPYCRTCDYNLTGLESPRCPECGSEDVKNVVRGEQRKRPVLLTVALFLFLSSGTGLYFQTMAASLLPGQPFSHVLWRAKWGNAPANKEIRS